jgi:hypothetical protein
MVQRTTTLDELNGRTLEELLDEVAGSRQFQISGGLL